MKEFRAKCHSNIDFFQLRSVELPTAFEVAIQDTEVKKQDIQKATAEKQKQVIMFETLRKTADYQRNVTLVVYINALIKESGGGRGPGDNPAVRGERAILPDRAGQVFERVRLLKKGTGK